MERIHPYIYRIDGTVANQYLVIDQNNIILIDTGLPNNTAKIIKAINSLGKNITDLRQIWITHSDGDHYGSVNALVRMSKAITFASHIEADAIRNGKSTRPLRPNGILKFLLPLFSMFFKTSPTPVDEMLIPGQILPIFDGIQILDSKGHTPGHISFFNPSDRILFSGDSICINGKQTTPSRGANTWDINLANQSYDYQMSFEPIMICAGHGYLRLSK